MLLRISASKDTFVTNIVVLGQPVISSSAGSSEILEVYKLASLPNSGVLGNALITFPSSTISTMTGSYTGSISWHLVMKNIETENPAVEDFDVEILPLERDWNEGSGQDIDYWTDLGSANYIYAKRGIAWTNPGARPSVPVSGVAFHFDTGHEDVDVDVTQMIVSGSASYGFWVGISSTLVQDTNDYYLKAFRSRQTHYPQYQPYLEARWDDTGGSNFSSSFIDIVDATGVLVGSIYNLQSVYDYTEVPILRTYFRPNDWNMAINTTGSSDVSGTILTQAYYRVVDNVSNEIVIPFGTGSPAYTKLSYDDAGNYFMFPMQNLVPGMVYRFDIGYYDISGSWHVNRGDDLTFRIY